eukprot:GHVO01038768.1.p1 GENE.GHVO01038768.1~~GHVO01038768.1.p1  ORF type:complete len:1348 (+),score=172.91 GHVO01038768.1:180-4223(+)
MESDEILEATWVWDNDENLKSMSMIQRSQKAIRVAIVNLATKESISCHHGFDECAYFDPSIISKSGKCAWLEISSFHPNMVFLLMPDVQTLCGRHENITELLVWYSELYQALMDGFPKDLPVVVNFILSSCITQSSNSCYISFLNCLRAECRQMGQASLCAKLISISAPNISVAAFKAARDIALSHVYNNLETSSDYAIGEDGAVGVRKIRRVTIPCVGTEDLFCEKTIIITGGCGALGRHTCFWLSAKGARRIFLLTSRKKDSEHWNAMLVAENLNPETVKVLYCDITDYDALSVVFSSIEEGCYNDGNPVKVDYVYHLAGHLADSLLQNCRHEQMLTILKPKILGAQNLHQLTASRGIENLIFFSSLTSLLGNCGQCLYGLANGAMDEIAGFRRANGLPAVSIQWGPWDTASMSDAVLLKCPKIPPCSAFKMMEHVQTARKDSPAVLAILRTDFGVTAADTNQTTSSNAAPLIMTENLTRDALTQICIKACYQNINGVDFDITHMSQDEQLAFMSTPFPNLGMDSLSIIGFRNTLQQTLRIDLPLSLILQHKDVAHITNAIWQTLYDIPTPQATAPITPSRIHDDPIVVVGMSCRFSNGCTSPHNLLRISCGDVPEFAPDIPTDLVDLTSYYEPCVEEAVAKCLTYSKCGWAVSRMDAFWKDAIDGSDNADPQHSLAVALAAEAIKDVPNVKNSAIGTFCAMTDQNWMREGIVEFDRRTAELRKTEDADFASMHTKLRALATGGHPSLLSGRIARCFDLVGPTVTIDTGCASGLTVVDVAVSQIRAGSCPGAVITAVSSMDSHAQFVLFSHLKMLSKSGSCRPFDPDADGLVRGEGGAAILIMTQSEAAKRGAKIHGTIRSIQSTHDGATVQTALPSVESYRSALTAVTKGSNIEPSSVRCYEAFGLGLPVADEIELEALKSVFGGDGRKNTLRVSAIHPVIGHAEASVAMGLMIRLIMSLKTLTVPKIHNLRNKKSAIDARASGVVLATRNLRIPKPKNGEAVLGAAMAHGMGGTNTAIVMEVSPDATPIDLPRRRLCFVFTGQGGAFAGMGDELSQSNEVFRTILTKCKDLVSIEMSAIDSKLAQIILHDDPILSQISGVSLQLALVTALEASGVIPAVVVGSSVGEIAAAFAAGYLSLEQSIKLVCKRATLLALRCKSQDQKMAACHCDWDDLRSALEIQPDVCVAANNSPRDYVISGRAQEVVNVVGVLKERGKRCTVLGLPVAYHSTFVEECAGEFEADSDFWARLGPVLPCPGKPVWISTVDVEAVSEIDGSYWAKNMRHPVQFWRALESAMRMGVDAVIEIGTRPVLLRLCSENLASDVECLECFMRDCETSMFESIF